MISSHPTMGFATTVQWVPALGLVLHCGSRSRADLQAPCRWVRSDGSRPICKGLAPFSGGRCCDTWGRVRTPDIAAARPCGRRQHASARRMLPLWTPATVEKINWAHYGAVLCALRQMVCHALPTWVWCIT